MPAARRPRKTCSIDSGSGWPKSWPRTTAFTGRAGRDQRSLRAHQEIAARPEQWIYDVRSTALDLSGGRVWIEKVRTATTLPANLDEALLSDGPLGELARLIEELRGDPEAVLRLLADDLGELRKKLPAELTEGPDAIDLGKPDTTGELLDQVRQMLVGQMVSREGPK